jgi:hypothetical protein
VPVTFHSEIARYPLTVTGQFAPVIITNESRRNRFPTMTEVAVEGFEAVGQRLPSPVPRWLVTKLPR